MRKSETIDLAMPIDQALQFVVSCGVVIPEEEIQQHVSSEPEAQRRLADRLALEN